MTTITGYTPLGIKYRLEKIVCHNDLINTWLLPNIGITFLDLVEYCLRETFHAQCQEDEVIMITHARYGRMDLGRCITVDSKRFEVLKILF